MESIQHFRPNFFKDCSICPQELDGQVCISKRCFHVFHEACIKQWLTEEKDTCPNCKLENFAVYELLPNPEYSEEYNKWKAAPENYKLENPEILKPSELRGKPQRRELTFEEIQKYFNDRNIKIQNLTGYSTQAEIAKASRESNKAQGMMLDYLKEQSAHQNASLKGLESTLDQVEKNNAHRHLIRGYNKKADDFEKKIELEITTLEKQKPRANELISQFRKVSKKLTEFSQSFDEAGLASPIFPDKPSIEESRELLKNVDDELNEYLESLPEDIQAVLNYPLPEPVAIEQPVINQPVQEENQRPNKWISRKTMAKIAFVATSVLLIYCLWKSRHSGNLQKNIKTQNPDL